MLVARPNALGELLERQVERRGKPMEHADGRLLPSDLDPRKISLAFRSAERRANGDHGRVTANMTP